MQGGFDPNGPQFQEGPAPGPLVQPPDPRLQQGPAPPQPITLGQVNDQMGGMPQLAPQPNVGANNYLEQYLSALGVAHQMIAPAREPMPDPQQGAPGLLENLATFGFAGLFHRDAVQHQAAQAMRHNQGLELAAATLAKDIVNSRARSDALGFGQNMQMMGMNLRLSQFQEQ